MEQIELIEKRKPREKHFLQKDGTIRAEIYDKDVHYLKNGRYEEIDNSLVKKNGSLVNKNNAYLVEFKEDFKDSLMKMSKDGYYIDFKIKDIKSSNLKSAKRVLSKQMNNCVSNEITDDISIEYQSLPNKVKETIVLKNANHSRFRFELDTNINLKEENGEIIALDEEKNIIFKIEKPFMIDSNNIINEKVHYLLNKYDDAFILDLVLDDEWLQESNRQFPVFIDPTITNEGQNITFQDTYIYPGDSNEIRYNKAYLKAGVEKVNGQNRVNRTLIKFSLPTIGTGSEIVYATLDLTSYPTYSSNPTERVATIHQITSDWDETTANWNNMNDKFEAKVESIFFGHRSTIDNNTIIPAYSYYDGNITNIVKKWYRNEPNYGLMIKSVNEGEYVDDDFPTFYSNNNNIIENNPKPVVSIVYRNHNGLENYLDYKEQKFSIGSSFVNTYNGNLTSVFNIGQTVGGNLPINLKIIYNTNDVILNNETFFKKGFRLNYEQTIKTVSIDNVNYLEYLDEDGTIHYFKNNDNNDLYYDEDGLGLSIEKNNSSCIMKDEDGNTLTFNNISGIYKLISINNIDNDTISIVLNSDNSIQKIIDKYNNEVNITYGTNVTTIVSSTGTVNIVYSDNKLCRIETSCGNININYENELIESIIDTTGITTKYEYYPNTPYRIKKVTRVGLNNTTGEHFSLKYGFDSTSIINGDGRTITQIYNSYGNLLSKNSLVSEEDIDNAYSATMVVDQSDNNKNSIISKEAPIQYIKNYLTNASFEVNDLNFTLDSGLNYSFDSNNYHSGLRSLKVEALVSSKKMIQNVTVPKENSYTFSGYIKNSGKIKISLSYYNSNNERIESSEIIDINNDFDFNDVTIYYDEFATTDLNIEIEFIDIGIAYIDDIQLEKGEVANNFNLIENSDFSNGFSDWDLNAWTDDDSTISPDSSFSVARFNNDKNTALKVSVNPTYGVSFSKTIPVSGKQGDLYICSFWFKNQGYPGYARTAGSEMSIYFKPVGGDAEYCIATSGFFNPNDEEWQFFTYKAHAPEDFESIKLVFLIGREANDFYLTNLSLYKNITGGQYNYDDNGNLITMSDQSNNTISFKYDTNNQLISMIDSSGKNYKYEYDNERKSRLLRTISSNGISSEIHYDNNGNSVMTKTKKCYDNDIETGIYKIRNKGSYSFLKAELNSVLLEKNECSNTIWRIEKINNQYKIKYGLYPQYSISYRDGFVSLDEDDSNNLFYIEENTESLNGTYFIKYYDETPDGTNIKFLTVDNGILKFETFSSNSSIIQFYIELDNNLFIENDAEYTSDGRFLRKITDSNLLSKEFTYNSNNGLISSITNTNGKNTSFLYNAKNQLVKVSYENKEVDYEYNQYNLLSKIIQNNKEYGLFYDDFLNLNRVTLNNNINLVNYLYNTAYQLVRTSFDNNNEVNYEYDSFGRIIRTQKMDNDIYYYYGNDGFLSKIKDDRGTYKYYYDISGRLYRYKEDNFKLNITYDNSDSIIKKEYIKGNNIHELIIEYTDDLPTNVLTDNSEINYEYDELDRVINKNIDEIASVSYDYKSTGKRTTNIIKRYTLNNNISEFEYDNIGNITDVYLNNSLIKHYEYDVYGELILEYNYDLNNYTEYIYDSAGNLTQTVVKQISDNTIIEQHNGVYSNSLWEDQLMSYDNNAIVYDSIGNMTQFGEYNYEWKNGKELTKITNNANNSIINYYYNSQGKRVGKTVGNIQTKYFLDGNNIIFEERNNNNIYYLYDLDGLIGLEYNNQKYYYEKNLFNDIIGIFDSAGNRLVKYKYDSWGKIVNILDNNNNEIYDNNNIGIINPFRYRSYYYDSESQMYYLGNRYYNPEIKRFISPDMMIGSNQDVYGNNLYLYVSNNPINNTDHGGNVLLGLLLGFALSKLSKNKKKNNKKKKASDTKKTNKTKKKNSVVSVTTSNTTQNNITFGGLVKQSVWSDVSYNNYSTYTSKVYGNNGKVNIDFNTTNLFEQSISLSVKTPIGDISYSKGFNNSSLRIEREYDSNKTRNVFECGNDMLSFYCESGYDSYYDESKYTTNTTKVSFGKVMVALAVLVGAEIGVEETIGILVKAVA